MADYNYKFNDINLPKLPDWDKTVYPYAYITTEGGGHALYASAVPMYFEYTYSMPTMFYNKFWKKEAGVCKKWKLSTATSYEWEDAGESDNMSYLINLVKWCNVDCLNYSNDTLRLAASYPINLETGEEVHDYAFGEPEPEPEPETPEPTLTARDLYKIINGKPTKLTLYKKLGGKLIPLDEHTKEVKT